MIDKIGRVFRCDSEHTIKALNCEIRCGKTANRRRLWLLVDGYAAWIPDTWVPFGPIERISSACLLVMRAT